MVNLHVKHASRVYDVSVDASESGIALKQQLEALTDVPSARQKVMVKGRQLQDDQALSGLKDGQALFMLGSKPAEPTEKGAEAGKPAETGPVEAQPEEDEEDVYEEPLGLVNIGNSCYANATLEALHTVPELNQALTKYRGPDQLLSAWGQLVPQFGERSSQAAPTPLSFLMRLQQRFPQFGERGEDGLPKQQDAEEFWTQLMWELRAVDTPEMRDVAASFDGQFKVTTERAGEQHVESVEDFTKLMCHISIHTNFLKDGLRASLVDEAETSSGGLKSSKRIAKLPKYLTVQFVRFFWRRDTHKNSKILRKVTFPLNLDLGDLCTPELQARMAPAREAYRELEGAIEENKRAARRAKFTRIDAVPEDPADESSAAKRRAAALAEQQEEDKDKQRLADLKTKFTTSIDPDLAADPSGSPHGLYELQAVVTHQGMSADSGHYQCFTRNNTKENSWWRFNDDRVSEVDENRIGQLAGGGASDSALILLYRSADY